MHEPIRKIHSRNETTRAPWHTRPARITLPSPS